MANITKLNPYHIEELKKNKYVLDANIDRILYSNEFKKRTIILGLEGYTAKQVFTECGFDISYLGTRPTEQIKRWKKQYKLHGIEVFQDKHLLPRNIKSVLSKDQQILNLKKELKRTKQELAFIKKLEKIESEVICKRSMTGEKFKLIRKISKKNSFTISALCSLANVSRSGYYNYFSSTSISNRKQRSLTLIANVNLIKRVIEYKGFNKGSRSVKVLLYTLYGKKMSLNKIQKIMRENGMRSQIRKSNAHRQMNLRRKEHNVVKNTLQRNFKTGIPRKVLLTDITYLFYNGHKKRAYLSAIKDTESNEIISYVTSENLDINTVLMTLDTLKSDSIFKQQNHTIIHSDQGSQYTTLKYQNKVKELGMSQSMSRKANCWDNAPIESFFSILKQEINISNVNNFADLKTYIKNYIYYYNNERPQLSLNNLTPTEKLDNLLSMGSKICPLQRC